MIPPASIEMTFTNVDLHVFHLLTGLTPLDTTPTPQNRDAWRRGTLQKADS
jgi:hypothetical protein